MVPNAAAVAAVVATAPTAGVNDDALPKDDEEDDDDVVSPDIERRGVFPPGVRIAVRRNTEEPAAASNLLDNVLATVAFRFSSASAISCSI